MIFLWLTFIMAAGVNLVQAEFADPDMVGPWWAMNLVPVWVGCLIFAGIMASGISTLNTLAMTVGQAIGRDIYHKVINPNAKEQTVVIITRIGIMGAGIIAIIGALLKPALVAFVGLWAAGIFACTYLPAILLSLYDKKATSKGIITGMVVGICLYIPLSVVESSVTAIKFTTNYIFPGVIWSTIVATIVMIVASRMTKPTAEEGVSRQNYLRRMFPFGRVLGIELGEKITWKDYAIPVVNIVATLAFGAWLTMRFIS